MLKVIVNGVDIFNPIEEKLDKIIEYFVDFYGEKHRYRITQRIKSANFFFVPRQGGLSLANRIEDYYSKKIDSVYDSFFQTFPIYNPKPGSILNVNIAKNLRLKLASGQILNHDVIPICDVIDMFGVEVFSERLPLIERHWAGLKEWLEKDKNYNALDNVLKKIIYEWEKYYAGDVAKLYAEKQRALDVVEEHEKVILKYKRNSELILKRAILYYLLQQKPCFSDVDRLSIMQYADTFISILKIGQKEFLKRGNIWKAFNNDCIKFFNSLGFMLGNDIKAYKNNQALMNFLFNETTLKLYNQAVKQGRDEEFGHNPYLYDIYEKMSQINFEGDKKTCIANMLGFAIKKSNTAAYVQPYINKSGDFSNVCVCGDGIEMCDASLFHEINHIIESDLLLKLENGFISKSGFEAIYSPDSNLKQPRGKGNHRRDELLNEVINDYISLMIYKKAKGDGFTICNGEDYDSQYSIAFPLLEKYILKYKNEIIECRMSDNPLMFAKKIGTERFEKLSNLVDDYFELIEDDGKIAKIVFEICTKTNLKRFSLENIDALMGEDKNWSNNVLDLFNIFKGIKNIFNEYERESKNKTINDKQ